MRGRKYLLVKGRAGLGNRVLCLLTAILYARLAQRRLLVDWSDPPYSNDGSNVIHRLFTSKYLAPSDQIPVTDSVRPGLWRGRLHDSAVAIQQKHAPLLMSDPLGWRGFSVNLSKLDYEEEVLVMWTFFPLIDEMRRHLRGSFSDLSALDTEAILRRLLRESIEVHPAIQERANKLRNTWPPGPVIGVHVRYTDRQTNLPAARLKVDALQAQHPGAPIFLTTDSKAVEDLFRRNYRGLITAPRWYSPRGRALHQDPERPDAAERAEEALIDLCLLAGCDHLVLDTSSSFSRLAALLADERVSRTHDVRKWSIVPPSFRDRLLWRFLASIKWGPRRILSTLHP